MSGITANYHTPKDPKPTLCTTPDCFNFLSQSLHQTYTKGESKPVKEIHETWKRGEPKSEKEVHQTSGREEEI